MTHWAKRYLASGIHDLSDSSVCFRSVTKANCHHETVVTGGMHPSDLLRFRSITALLGNFKSSLSRTFYTLSVTITLGATLAARASASTVSFRYLG
jgi:hypothetical protein